jgi:hypothetical protein
MATRKIVPRANGEGAIGDNTQGIEKYWGGGYFLDINGTDAIEMAKFNDTLQWKPETTYAVGDIVFTSRLNAGLYLECTTEGESDSTIFTVPSVIVPGTTTITDGTVTWTIRKIGSSSGGEGGGGGVPIGTIIPFSGDTTALPVGFLECNGAAVPRTMFPDLFALIGTKYGEGDGSTTFNLPDYSFIVEDGTNVFGNGKALAFTDGTILFAPRTSSSSAMAYTTAAYGKNDGDALTSGTGLTSGKVAGIATKELLGNTPENSGLTAELPTDSNTIYLIKAFNGQTEDSALIDITQYAQDLADLNLAVDNIKANYARVVSFDATTATLTLATP